jgi:hypothetical protein
VAWVINIVGSVPRDSTPHSKHAISMPLALILWSVGSVSGRFEAIGLRGFNVGLGSASGSLVSATHKRLRELVEGSRDDQFGHAIIGIAQELRQDMVVVSANQRQTIANDRWRPRKFGAHRLDNRTLIAPGQKVFPSEQLRIGTQPHRVEHSMGGHRRRLELRFQYIDCNRRRKLAQYVI